MKKAITFCLFFASSLAFAGPEEKINQSFYKSYIAAIKNGLGARIFRQLYLYDKDADRVVEVLQNGNLSCAYFTSSILHHFGLIKNYHDSVKDTVEDMKNSGWKKAEHPVSGNVIVWSEAYFKKSKSMHGHIGFYIGPGRAISTSSRLGVPVIHNLRPDGRKIIGIMRHPRLAPYGLDGKLFF